MLDSYEDYVDQYISYMKKVSKGDMSAMADAPALMEKAQEWGDEMENTKEEMTARQMARMSTISNKMTIAMSDMMDEQKIKKKTTSITTWFFIYHNMNIREI